jgi:hypothetical protein
MKKLLALLLAVMLVVSMAACGKTDAAPTTAPTTAPEKEPEPAGTLYVAFGAALEMVFDSNCETISITGTNDLGKLIADANQNQLNKGCVFALRAILRYASDNSLLGDAKTMAIRVGAKDTLPKADFLEEIQTDCQYLADEECTGIRIVPLVGDMLDSDGNITAAAAKKLACRFMEAEDADVTGGEAAADGVFTFVCGEKSCTVDAFSGLVKAAA